MMKWHRANRTCRNGKRNSKDRQKIAQDKDRLEIDTEQQQPIELDEKELKKYVDLVISEVKRGRT